MREIEAKSVYNQEVPEETQREGAMEDGALRFALAKVGREVKRKLTRSPKVPGKPLIQGHGRHI